MQLKMNPFESQNVEEEHLKNAFFEWWLKKLENPSNTDAEFLSKLCCKYNAKTTHQQLFGFCSNKRLRMGETALDLIQKANIDDFEIILSKGYPEVTMECRECRRHLSRHHFFFYRTRLDKDGYYSRLNAICKTCAKELNRERHVTLHDQMKNIPPRPKPGDICGSCNRPHSKRWHRDHDPETHTFIGWKCHLCNMSRHDQRNLLKNSD